MSRGLCSIVYLNVRMLSSWVFFDARAGVFAYSLAFNVLSKVGGLDGELLLTRARLLSPLRDVVASGLQGTPGGGCGASLSL
jgi:hypothetical protein